MLILALDTTSEFGSLALVNNGSVLEEVKLHAPQGFSGILFAEIRGLLQRQAVTLSQVDLFAAASGPGSFTGVRVGLAAVKGLGEFMGKPVATVSNLKALAELGSGELRAVIIDAHRSEVFAALYNDAGVEIISEQVIPLARFLELLGDQGCQWVPDAGPTPVLAAVIAKIAARHASTDAVGIKANYVRRSDAELLWKGN